ncbi:hypothetical protein [Poriferisphaera sp. WC338]|uniref:hypothetical protein n=1 Tax=Poriferisphaera sp. WC338 TaxID=3425129 RepID=UPI003D8140E6
MKQSLRLTLLICISVFLVLGCVWSFIKHHQYRVAAINKIGDYHKAVAIIDQIKTHKDKPKLVESEGVKLSDMRVRLEQAAQKSNVPTLGSVWSDTARRVDKTPFLIQSTRVTIDKANMEQILKLSWQIEKNNSSLNVAGIRLAAIDGDEGRQEFWKSDLTLTHLIYSPKD